MKIIQITAAVENWHPNGEFKTPNEDATVFGLGDDGKVYTCVRKLIVLPETPCLEEGDHVGHEDCNFGSGMIKHVRFEQKWTPLYE